MRGRLKIFSLFFSQKYCNSSKNMNFARGYFILFIIKITVAKECLISKIEVVGSE